MPGPWDLYLRDFSDRGTPVFGGIFVGGLWLDLYQAIVRRGVMKVVIVKPPRFLGGILRRIFHIKA